MIFENQVYNNEKSFRTPARARNRKSLISLKKAVFEDMAPVLPALADYRPTKWG